MMSNTETATITLTPYICVKGGLEAIAFYEKAFGATEVHRIMDGDRVSHAQVDIGGARLYLADEHPEIDVLSPLSRDGSATLLHLTVAEVDPLFERAIAAGATVRRPVKDQGDGHRHGVLRDPFGHDWMLSSFS